MQIEAIIAHGKTMLSLNQQRRLMVTQLNDLNTDLSDATMRQQFDKASGLDHEIHQLRQDLAELDNRIRAVS